ncbi:MAG: hypothetical protein DDT33_01377 [Firmicutes bacterium]|nr:hypothetical protein [Bacillota bacterium]
MEYHREDIRPQYQAPENKGIKRTDLRKYSLKEIMRRVNHINVTICCQHNRPFPKSREHLRSWYTHEKRWIRIENTGYVNKCRFVASLIDFTFIRSLVADCYSKEGAPPYDPCSIFLLDLFRLLENHKSMLQFHKKFSSLKDGYHYRLYAGIREDSIPCPADFSNFRGRIGKERYNRISHILIEIVRALDLITGAILSHDGTLVPTWSRYHGCNYASCQCEEIAITNRNFLAETRERILKLLEYPKNIPIGKEFKAFAKCPRADVFPEGIKPHSIGILSFSLLPFDPDGFDHNDQTTKLLGIDFLLRYHGLMLKTQKSNIRKIELNLQGNPIYVRCPKVPADLEAKVGYRRRKDNPEKKEGVFGFQVVITTSVESHLGIELPVAVITGPASMKDGNCFIPLREQIKEHHPFKTVIDIGDAGFDKVDNYNYCRQESSIPLIDYNRRGEDLSPERLKKRGYDENGYPFSPCDRTCHPNGFDKEKKRLSFVCGKRCLSETPLKPSGCPHRGNSAGYSTHMSIKEHPRLVCEIPRRSAHWKEIRNLRVSSERTNSGAKNNELLILEKPRVMGVERTAILANLACISLLLSRVINFIVKVTLSLHRYLTQRTKENFLALLGPKVPYIFRKVIYQRE